MIIHRSYEKALKEYVLTGYSLFLFRVLKGKMYDVPESSGIYGYMPNGYAQTLSLAITDWSESFDGHYGVIKFLSGTTDYIPSDYPIKINFDGEFIDIIFVLSSPDMYPNEKISICRKNILYFNRGIFDWKKIV